MLPEITEALRRGDLRAAANGARGLLADQPDNAAAHHLLGLALRGSGDTEGARAAFDRAIALEPERAVYQLSRGLLSLQQQDLEAAEADLRQASNLDPNQLPAYVGLIHAALARGDNAEAERLLKYAQRVDADHPQVRVAAGHLAQLGGRNDEALAHFSFAVEKDPGLTLGFVSMGLQYLQRGLGAFAVQAFRKAEALDPTNPGVLRGLAEGLRREGQVEEALGVLDRLVSLQPDALGNRAVRIGLLMAAGKIEAAMADLEAVLDRQPEHLPALNQLLPLLVRHQRLDDAIARSEAALARNPGKDALWSLRMGLCQDAQQAEGVLARWRMARPDSSLAMEAEADQLERAGRWSEAEALADRVLAETAGAPAAQMIKLRAEMRRDPLKALARTDQLLPAAINAESQRMTYGWRGLALDALGRHAEAAASFRELLRRALPQQLPLPEQLPARQVPEGEAAGILLWAPPGARVERVFDAIAPLLGPRFLFDRMLPNSRDDSFGHRRMRPGGPLSGSAARWREAVVAVGRDPETVVDWLPHFDAYAGAALRGARVVALLVDPRDALLNWLVYGSAQGYQFLHDPRINAEWMSLSLGALADLREREPGRVQLIALDGVHDGEAQQVAQALQAALRLEQAPDAALLAEPILAAGGFPNQFPHGHWRRYREAFAEEFALLTPVALRLGYPEQ
jgi:tetratricopeptide (TPR) repeat protein